MLSDSENAHCNAQKIYSPGKQWEKDEYIFITVSGHTDHYTMLVIIITNIIVNIIIHYTLNIKNIIIIILY